MTILVDWELESALNDGEIILDPLDKSLINSQSIDFRLGDTYSAYYKNSPIVDPSNPESFSFESFTAGSYVLDPDEFIIASSLERIKLAPNITAKLSGKSSLGRLGLENSEVAGWIDGGFEGHITLELKNIGPYPLLLKAGMKIGQIIFARTEVPEKHYGNRGRYVGQGPAQGSLGL